MDESIWVVWMLVSIPLVLIMTPGLAFFYGGLVKAKSVISMMMLSFGSMGLITVLWVLYGNNMAVISGNEMIAKFVGQPGPLAQNGVAGADLIAVTFGATFAIITVALISGAVADRARFFPWLIFAGVWATVSYFPIAGWVWGGGWIASFGQDFSLPEVIDWAGGTAVHINAGAAALALALVLGQRREGFSKTDARPHNVPLVLIGAALLWFGWFGFNAGAATDSNTAGLIMVNTLVAPAAGILGYLLVEHIKDGKATAVGAASGVVAGLVAITPSAANLTPLWAIVLGTLAGVACAYAIDLKFKLGYDDSLDVVGLHLVAGFLGTIFLGFFATDTGLFTGGNGAQLISQTVPAIAVAAYAFVSAWVIAQLISKTIGFRADVDDEIAGLDLALHGTKGYFFE